MEFEQREGADCEAELERGWDLTRGGGAMEGDLPNEGNMAPRMHTTSAAAAPTAAQTGSAALEVEVVYEDASEEEGPGFAAGLVQCKRLKGRDGDAATHPPAREAEDAVAALSARVMSSLAEQQRRTRGDSRQLIPLVESALLRLRQDRGSGSVTLSVLRREVVRAGGAAQQGSWSRYLLALLSVVHSTNSALGERRICTSSGDQGREGGALAGMKLEAGEGGRDVVVCWGG